MKFLIALFICFFSLHSLGVSHDRAMQRSNRILQFLVAQKGLRNIALGTVIGNRCSRYLPYEKKAACHYSVEKMIELLDFDMIVTTKSFVPTASKSWLPGSFVFVAFKSNLLMFLSQEKVFFYLKDLNQRLYDFLLNKTAIPNLWEITKSHFKSDTVTARVIATLFQDTGPTKLHLAWIELAQLQETETFTDNKFLLDQVIETINLVLDSSEENIKTLFYPREIQKHLNRNIYHFYVPFLLALDLQEKENLKEEYSYLASLMLTLTYEFVTSAQDYKYLLADPPKVTSTQKLMDIYSSYLGANLATGFFSYPKSFSFIQNIFKSSTQQGVGVLLNP